MIKGSVWDLAHPQFNNCKLKGHAYDVTLLPELYKLKTCLLEQILFFVFTVIDLCFHELLGGQ